MYRKIVTSAASVRDRKNRQQKPLMPSAVAAIAPLHEFVDRDKLKALVSGKYDRALLYESHLSARRGHPMPSPLPLKSLPRGSVAPPCCIWRQQLGQKRCPILKFLAPQLFLSSYLLSTDALQLRHFLAHYSASGIQLNHVSLTIRLLRLSRGTSKLIPFGSHSSLNETLEVARTSGVPQQNIRIATEPASDARKLALINEQLARLSPRAWFIYADVDELFDYPCNLRELTAARSAVAGKMCDQLAIGAGMPKLRYEPDIALQFPIQCHIRQRLFGNSMQHSKTILQRARARSGNRSEAVRFVTTHRTTDRDSLAPPAGVVRHYSMSEQQMNGNALKTSMGSGKAGGGVSNFANATCGRAYGKVGGILNDGLNDTAPRWCDEYFRLWAWQRKQMLRSRERGWAGLSRYFCPGCRNVSEGICEPWLTC